MISAKSLLPLDPYSTKDEKGRVFYFTNQMREILTEQRERVNQLQKKFRKIIPNVFVNDHGMPLFEVNHDKEELSTQSRAVLQGALGHCLPEIKGFQNDP